MRGPNSQPRGFQSAGSQRHGENSEPIDNREEVAYIPVQVMLESSTNRF